MKEKNIGVIIDAGHGGIDSGAVGNNLQEKDLTLEVSKYIYNRLKELGIPTKMTREEDIYLPKQDRIEKVLSLYNNSPNTILISNHINAGGAEGAEVVYSLKNNPTLAQLILNNIKEKGQISRKIYQRRLPENPNKDYYYILRESGNTEPVLIEYGFIDNKKDSDKLKNNIIDYGEGVVKAITEYIGYPYTPPNQDISQDEYIVKKGDTLYSISKKFNIPLETIKRINNLEDNTISINQKLLLTETIDNINTEIYTVQKGDTLYKISSDNNISVDELKKINNLTSNTLSIGQKLLIPLKKEIIDIDEINNYQIYKVQKGDSLWSISKKYNISVPELIDLNNLEDLTLQINQELLVPNSNDNNTYTVQKGDTLWSVAKKFNLTVDELKELNNLTTNLLSIGQSLLIK